MATRRVLGQATAGFPNRTSAAIGIVAVAVALLVVVTSVSAGLAAGTTVRGEDVDYWILPETESTAATVVTVEGTQLGDVHANTARIREIDGVGSATPVLVELVQMRVQGGDTTEWVLGIGVVPNARGTAIAGVSTRAMGGGDPYYADGKYDGAFTGQVVLSPAAASILNASAGDGLRVSSPASIRIAQSFAVTAVSETGLDTVRGQVPVAVFRLSELQAYTGAAEGDQADQILVRTNRPGVKPALEAAYPEATVVARSGVTTRQVLDADLPLAMSLTAFVVGIVVAGLFVATTMGLTVEADRRELAVLATLGFSTRARLGLVAATTVLVTLAGGVLGLVVGVLGVVAVNLVATTQLGVAPIALLHPLLVPYGLGVALAMGLVAMPYPVLLARRTDTLAELGR